MPSTVSYHLIWNVDKIPSYQLLVSSMATKEPDLESEDLDLSFGFTTHYFIIPGK